MPLKINVHDEGKTFREGKPTRFLKTTKKAKQWQLAEKYNAQMDISAFVVDFRFRMEKKVGETGYKNYAEEIHRIDINSLQKNEKPIVILSSLLFFQFGQCSRHF